MPAIEYGDWAGVEARIRKVITQLKHGASFHELMTADGLLDTATHGGLVCIDGPNSGGGGPHFHAFAATRLIGKEWLAKRVPDALWDSIFTASLATPWGVLGLFGPGDPHWLWPRQKRFEPFLHAALAVWKELDAVGPRYSSGVDYGSPLWDVMPLCFIIMGGVEMGDIHVGYGPARAFTSGDVRNIDAALGTISRADLMARWDADRIRAADLHGVNGDLESKEYVGEYFEELKRFVSELARDDLGMIVYIT